MSTEILISSDPWENRVAVLENGALSEIYIEREEKVIGSIYKAKVQNVLPGMGASFVDIGLGRNAFLYVDDINKTPLNIGDVEITQGRSGWTISEKVNRGDDVLVQIVKEPRGLKGARVSTNISLPGRYLILMPTGKYSGVSRKIESADERNRLKAVMKRIRPEGMATVVRTAAAGVSEAELIADLGVLIRMWHGILEMYKRAASPSLLHKDMNLVYKAARDFVTADVDKVLIDNETEYKKVREFLQLLGPQYLDRVEYYNSGRSLFKDYKIDDELAKLMKPKINLPSGGSIVIETTEALTVIDVNSGKFTGGKNLEDTIVKTNVEAAAEIARQVRLRDIGGIIVCDFIDMSTESSRNKVIQTLEAGLRKDRTRSTIQSFSNLGLLEFTRKRIGKDLASQLRGPCPTCAGLGSVLSAQSVAIDTLRKVRAHEDHHAPILVESAPVVAAQLEFWYEDEFTELSKQLEQPIHVRVDAMLHPEKTRVRTMPEFSADGKVRVGDEREVELLPGRLPNATSAAAVIEGRIVEVENAANFAGQTMRVRVIDVEDDFALAELAQAAPAEKKKRRKRGGAKRRGELTSAEQTEQLRVLAEEAAEHARPPIGITTVTEEDERVDKVLRQEARAAQEPGAIVIDEHEAAHPAAEGEGAEHGNGHRRRRRRRRGGRGRGADQALQNVGMTPESAEAQIDEEEDEAEIETAAGQQPAFSGAPAEGEAGGRRRRRRRRRRGGRGRGGEVEGLTGQLPQAVPDRHIFRVGADGHAEPTGATAPPEPNRSLARVRAGSQPPAVEAPPPHLRAPEEGARATKPAGRRRTTAAQPKRGGELPAAAMPALPGIAKAEPAPKRGRRVKAAEPAEAPAAAKSTRVPRRTKAVAEVPAPPEEAKPKRTTRAKKAEPAAAIAEAKPKRTSTRKTAAPKAAAEKAPAVKATGTRKKSPAAKTTATRKKKS